MTTPMRVHVESKDTVAVVRLSGHLGIESHRTLKEACERCLTDPVVDELRLDCSGVDSTDATAMGLLLVLRERGFAAHKALSLAHAESLAESGVGVDDLKRFFCVV